MVYLLLKAVLYDNSIPYFRVLSCYLIFQFHLITHIILAKSQRFYPVDNPVAVALLVEYGDLVLLILLVKYRLIHITLRSPNHPTFVFLNIREAYLLLPVI